MKDGWSNGAGSAGRDSLPTDELTGDVLVLIEGDDAAHAGPQRSARQRHDLV